MEPSKQSQQQILLSLRMAGSECWLEEQLDEELNANDDNDFAVDEDQPDANGNQRQCQLIAVLNRVYIDGHVIHADILLPYLSMCL